MKKIPILLLLFAFLFSSCGKPLLNVSDYGTEFQENNEMLYFDENCEHFLIYMDANEFSDEIDANVYHAVRCKWFPCEESLRYETHTLLVGTSGSTRAQYKENGYMYHTVTLICEKCNASVYLNVLCQRQDFACMTLEECRTAIRWEEILCDMPYEISYD